MQHNGYKENFRIDVKQTDTQLHKHTLLTLNSTDCLYYECYSHVDICVILNIVLIVCTTMFVNCNVYNIS